jgi:hypothetical protein
MKLNAKIKEKKLELLCSAPINPKNAHGAGSLYPNV